ncbi:cobyrinate a,c-diamide synthase [Bacillus solimangrovi]|uniref:Cobyrinate a,c-diamide synthase n=1 Tax=Bacillus solimangrovi TaxID=1305675 RepID=A0A1E5LGC1_9BACI|nr:cobyrinate a,c-diamide synthase [Bacillus solimangrovi]OEH93125.1 cobyrinic acid a,c-diamide synthase [Bacillus solimangrovi]
MSERRIVIAGTGSGVGKTTITLGIMAAMQQQGYTVQGFKCGPDYIDPTYHTAVTGRKSRNLDSWMLSHDVVKDIYNHGSEGADISIIEGVMGFYDGKNPKSDAGSTAEISVLTDSPVILVVNCASMARSAAAIVKGFQCLSTEPNIVGVIANRVGSEGHYKLVKAAIEQECNVPVVGYLKREQEIEIPERHLGLVPSIERGELNGFFNSLGNLVSETVDIEKLYELSLTNELQSVSNSMFAPAQTKDLRIAVAHDAAFNFYYKENLELLEAQGAKVEFFSPLNGDVVPDEVDGLYLGGGFPEEFAEQLAKNDDVKQSIQDCIEGGMPTLAECGGFMYLTEAIETTEGHRFPMVGLLPGIVKMQHKRAALGYRVITGSEDNFLLSSNAEAKGHEFHYSTYQCLEPLSYAYKTKGMRGIKEEGALRFNLVAGYTHLHFASCPEIVTNWLDKCRERKM